MYGLFLQFIVLLLQSLLHFIESAQPFDTGETRKLILYRPPLEYSWCSPVRKAILSSRENIFDLLFLRIWCDYLLSSTFIAKNELRLIYNLWLNAKIQRIVSWSKAAGVLISFHVFLIYLFSKKTFSSAGIARFYKNKWYFMLNLTWFSFRNFRGIEIDITRVKLAFNFSKLLTFTVFTS